MKNSYLQLDLNPDPFAYEEKSLSVALLDEISIEHLRLGYVIV